MRCLCHICEDNIMLLTPTDCFIEINPPYTDLYFESLDDKKYNNLYENQNKELIVVYKLIEEGRLINRFDTLGKIVHINKHEFISVSILTIEEKSNEVF